MVTSIDVIGETDRQTDTKKEAERERKEGEERLERYAFTVKIFGKQWG